MVPKEYGPPSPNSSKEGGDGSGFVRRRRGS